MMVLVVNGIGLVRSPGPAEGARSCTSFLLPTERARHYTDQRPEKS